MTKPKPRKTVSFKSVSDQGVKGTDGTNTDEALLFPTKNTMLLLPLHLPALALFTFKELKSNPLNGLLQGIPTLIAAQVAYGCLITTQFQSSRSKKAGKREKESENTPLLLIGSLIISLILTTPLFAIVILFGAPLYAHVYETFLLCTHLALVIFYPILVGYKLNFNALIRSFSPTSKDKVLQIVYKNQILLSSIGGIVGTWFGVFPIPLDWDRDWQQWPITLLIGGYGGYFLGSIIALLIGN
ncbi:glycosylphosphatidylinositol anchor biosynthesis protein 11 [[Candida] anglica]|uniref:Glycosylphosphatidylinositol anchor biosynthesis protein 11 n=1 Tax=[Candida] anglica TaxID=148631 RepID=A0ABP0E8C3_9ASCO